MLFSLIRVYSAHMDGVNWSLIMLNKWMAIGAALVAFSFTPVLAEEAEEKKMTKAEKVLADYKPTGKVENCLHLRSIRNSRVLDDQTILFRASGKKYYVNKLPHKCARLGFEKSFLYKTSLNQLCNVDIITVLDTTSGINGPSCGLGKFEELEKIKKSKSADS